jgi:hypothetical protein
MKRWLAVILLFWAQSVSAQEPVRITFDGDEVGKFPAGWVSEDQKDMTQVYSVQAEGNRKFLHADARNLSVLISTAVRWNLSESPMLRWRWRAVTFPTGSDEQTKDGDDSVLGLYAVFTARPFVTAIKYIWSDTLPAGMEFDSPYSSGTKMVVVRSGRALAGTWITEERNLLADYEQFLGKGEKNPVAQALAILTDSDNTRSRAVGDYADIITSSSK